MRLASLHSGGKDSSFALYIAEQMGHDVPYIVNIVPENGESWIFHVPNQDMVPLLASSMDKTLIRAITNGTEAGDMDALRTALDGLDVTGVVTGAVLSDYQWDRINTVCGELGLTVVSPLWRKDPEMIMDEMISSGIRAVMIGTYAEGLDEKWLGREIDANALDDLKKLNEKYGVSIIGEGGEFESLTIDSPMQHSVLEITDFDKCVSSSNGTMKIIGAVLVRK